jgi:hypothetical protein
MRLLPFAAAAPAELLTLKWLAPLIRRGVRRPLVAVGLEGRLAARGG